MSIEVDWGNQEETILVMKTNRKIDPTEFIHAQNRAKELAHQKVGHIDVILDMRAAAPTSSGLMPLARNAVKNIPTNLGRVAVITSTGFWSRVFTSLPEALVGHLSVRFVDTVDAAYAYLSNIDESNTGA